MTLKQVIFQWVSYCIFGVACGFVLALCAWAYFEPGHPSIGYSLNLFLKGIY